MNSLFAIPSSDPALLAKARQTAQAFAAPLRTEGVVGIVFLGAVARGYFDPAADIDIAIFKRRGADLPLKDKFYSVDGFEVQVWLSDYEDELTSDWDMARRWTYANAQIDYDPQGAAARLIAEKVPLRAEERKWLVMSGLTLSEWYVNRLTQLWVERGSLTSAHHMVDQGLLYFYDLLFGLNHALVADMKWRLYCVSRLELLPERFAERIQEVMLLRAFTVEELHRRRQAFMGLWEEMKPAAEAAAGMSFAEMLKVV